MKNYLFTSESVSEGHPDKVADQISDAILDQFLMQDPEAKVACESFCSTGMVVVMGEVKAEAYVDIQNTVRETIRKIGYTKAEYMFDANGCGVLSAIHEQSADINRGVERAKEEEQGAGDQGMMFGYACRDTEDYMPLPLYLSHKLLEILSDIRHNELSLMPYLRPDAKSQFTIEYDGETHAPVKVHTIVLSTQHDEFVPKSLGRMSYDAAVKQFGQAKVDLAMQQKIRQDVETILIPRLKESLAGAFSGKDPSKVDRSAAYAARYIAKNLVAAGVADECLVQLAYAIGVAQPVSVFVDTYGTAKNGLSDGEIAQKVQQLFDLTPAGIIKKFQLKNPIYAPTAAYGHMGRKPYTKAVTVQGKRKIVQFFGWELLDSVPAVKKAFSL